MDPELAKLLTTLGVAAVGVGGTALGAWINQRGARQAAERTLGTQRALSLTTDQRALRDKKRERLQNSFEQVLLAPKTLRDIVDQRRFTWEGESAEQRDARLATTLRSV